MEKTSDEIKAGIKKQTASHLQLHQITVARAETRLLSSRVFFLDAIETAWRQAQHPQPATLENRCAVRLATTFAVDSSVEVVQSMFALGGGTAIFESSRLQKYLREFLCCPNT